MRTSDPRILAAGDVANAWHPVLGARSRTEHWGTAIATGKVAASTILGGDAVHDDIPYFYTGQYDLGMEFSGYASLMTSARVVIRGDRAAREFIAFWLHDGALAAAMNVNMWDDGDALQALVDKQIRVDAETLRTADLASLV